LILLGLLLWQIGKGLKAGTITVWWQGRKDKPLVKCNREAQPQVFWITVAGYAVMAGFVGWLMSMWVIGDLVWNETAPTITAVESTDEGLLLTWEPPHRFDKPTHYLVHRVDAVTGESEQIGMAESVEQRLAIPDANDATSSLYLVEARYSGPAKWIVGDSSTVSEPATVSEGDHFR
jgi:hypothetical protein